MIIKKFKEMIMTKLGGRPQGIPARPVGAMTVRDIMTLIDGLDEDERVVLWEIVRKWADWKDFNRREEMRIRPDNARKILQIMTANCDTDEEKVETLLEFFASEWWDESLMIDILNQCLSPPNIRGKNIAKQTEEFDEDALFVGNEWFDPTPFEMDVGHGQTRTYIQTARDGSGIRKEHFDLLIKANVRCDEGWSVDERHSRRRIVKLKGGEREIADVQHGDEVNFHRKQTKGLVPLTGNDLVDLVEESEQEALIESIKPVSWLQQRLALITSSTVDPYKDYSDGGRYANWGDDYTWDESTKRGRLEETVEGLKYVTNERDEILSSSDNIWTSMLNQGEIPSAYTSDDNVVRIRKIRYDLRRAVNGVTAYPAIINGKIWKEFFDRHPKFREDDWEEDEGLAKEIYESGQLDKSEMKSLETQASKTVKSKKKKLKKRALKKAIKTETIRLLSEKLRGERGVTVITSNGFKRNARMMYVKRGTSGVNNWSLTYMVDSQNDKFKEPTKMVEIETWNNTSPGKAKRTMPLHVAKKKIVEMQGDDEGGKWFATYADNPTEGRLNYISMGFTILVGNLSGLPNDVRHHPLKNGILGLSNEKLTVYRQNSMMLPTSRKVVVEEFFSSEEELNNANESREKEMNSKKTEWLDQMAIIAEESEFESSSYDERATEVNRRLNLRRGFRPDDKKFRPAKLYAITRIYEYDVYRGEWRLKETEKHFKPIDVEKQTDKATANKPKLGNVKRTVRTKNGRKETTLSFTGDTFDVMAGFETHLNQLRNRED